MEQNGNLKLLPAYVAVVAAAGSLAITAAGMVRHRSLLGPAVAGIAGPLGFLCLASALWFTTLRSRTYYALIYTSIVLFAYVLLDGLIRFAFP